MKICYLAEANVIHTEKWAKSFADRGYEVHIISLEDKAIENVDVHPLRKVPFLGKFNYILNITLVKRLIKNISPDILHVHHASSYGLLGWLASPKKPFIITCHGSDILVFSRNIIAKRILKQILKRADLITSVARHLTEKIEILKINSDKIVTFQYGLELDKIKGITPKNEFDGITIISTRQLKKIYNYDLLINSVEILKNRLTNFKVLIVGGGPEEKRLKAMVKDMSLQKYIVFYGQAEHSEVIALLKGSDIFVSTSFSDGTSMCLLEAFACKILPVVTDIPANRELIVHKKNGFLFSPSSPKELANLIVKAINVSNKKDIKDYNYNYISKEQDSRKNMEYMDRIYKAMHKI